MAIGTLSKIAVTLTMDQAIGKAMNVWTYNVLEIIGTPTAGHYAEAWWNHVKTAYRALVPAGYGNSFQSVLVRELGNSTGEYGEYGIPAGEQVGTRTGGTDNDFMPSFAAAGVRLTVGTRVTRPGQKRFPFLQQGDVNVNSLGTTFNGLLVTLMDIMEANMTLGAPAAGVVLVPAVVSLNADGSIRTSQLVTGYKINPFVTSQNSRKAGRGM